MEVRQPSSAPAAAAFTTVSGVLYRGQALVSSSSRPMTLKSTDNLNSILHRAMLETFCQVCEVAQQHQCCGTR